MTMPEQKKISPKISGNVPTISLQTTPRLQDCQDYNPRNKKDSGVSVASQQALPKGRCFDSSPMKLFFSNDNTESMLQYLWQPSIKANRLGAWAWVLIGHR